MHMVTGFAIRVSSSRQRALIQSPGSAQGLGLAPGVCMYECVYVCMYVCMHILYLYGVMYAYVYACMYLCIVAEACCRNLTLSSEL